MTYYFIAIYSILLFPRFNTLIKAIKLKKNILSEVIVTLLSLLILVGLIFILDEGVNSSGQGK